jgi:hypothetical protein
MGSEGVAPPFLTSAVIGGEWPASRPGRFTPVKGHRVPILIGGWVGPRTGLDDTERRKISCPCRDSNPSRPDRSPSLYQLIYPVFICTFLVYSLSDLRSDHWVGWFRGADLNLDSWGSQFHSRLGRYLSRLRFFVIFLLTSRQMPG